ncbi:MAG: hypothetical protein RML56_01430 [Burkholderiales bacterium]|nr:hypothetical protein [Burkholderiales bacterium]
MSVEGAQLAFRDEASGQELNVVEANLKTGRLDSAQPGPVSLSLRATGKNPAVDLRAQASGALRLDFSRQSFGFDGFAAVAKGRVGSETLAVEFSAPKVEVTAARGQGAEVKASIQLRGPQRSLDARARLEGIQGNARALALSALELELRRVIRREYTVKGRISTPVQGNLDARTLGTAEDLGEPRARRPDASAENSGALAHRAGEGGSRPAERGARSRGEAR